MSSKAMTGYPSIDKPWMQYYAERADKISAEPESMFQMMERCNKDQLNTIALDLRSSKCKNGFPLGKAFFSLPIYYSSYLNLILNPVWFGYKGVKHYEPHFSLYARLSYRFHLNDMIMYCLVTKGSSLHFLSRI